MTRSAEASGSRSSSPVLLQEIVGLSIANSQPAPLDAFASERDRLREGIRELRIREHRRVGKGIEEGFKRRFVGIA